MASEVHVRTATATDAMDLAVHMRAADRSEVWASDRHTPAEALQGAMQASEVCRSLTIDGEVAAMWGVSVKLILPKTRSVWLLTSDMVDQRPLTFWRVFRAEVSGLLKRYPVLCNMVDARYTQSVEALRRVGFRICDPVPYGPDDLPFHFVIIQREMG